ncbi:MAG: hypothetical protein AAF610_15525, partial [Pseudomonadota bacterium]
GSIIRRAWTLDGLDGDGFLLEGSFSPSGNWLIVGSFTSVALDFDVDSTAFEVGGGYVWPQAQNFDVFATATFISASVDTNFGDADETGFGLTAGVRSRFTDNFEGRGEIKYADVGASDTLIRLSGDYYFTDQFVAGISVDVGGDADTFYVGGRWIFGSRKAK